MSCYRNNKLDYGKLKLEQMKSLFSILLSGTLWPDVQLILHKSNEQIHVGITTLTSVIIILIDIFTIISMLYIQTFQ